MDIKHIQTFRAMGVITQVQVDLLHIEMVGSLVEVEYGKVLVRRESSLGCVIAGGEGRRCSGGQEHFLQLFIYINLYLFCQWSSHI